MTRFIVIDVTEHSMHYSWHLCATKVNIMHYKNILIYMHDRKYCSVSFALRSHKPNFACWSLCRALCSPALQFTNSIIILVSTPWGSYYSMENDQKYLPTFCGSPIFLLLLFSTQTISFFFNSTNIFFCLNLNIFIVQQNIK